MMSSTSAVLMVVAFGDGLQHGRGQLLGMDVGQRAFADFADAARRAAGVDDQGFGHLGPRRKDIVPSDLSSALGPVKTGPPRAGMAQEKAKRAVAEGRQAG